jgi:hypothetical protein
VDAVDESSVADVMAEVPEALNKPESLEEVWDRLVRAARTAIPLSTSALLSKPLPLVFDRRGGQHIPAD